MKGQENFKIGDRVITQKRMCTFPTDTKGVIVGKNVGASKRCYAVYNFSFEDYWYYQDEGLRHLHKRPMKRK